MKKMKSVFKVEAIDQIKRSIDNQESNVYFIGVFSDIQKWKDIEIRYKQLPGFSKNTCKFHVEECEVAVNEECDLKCVYRLTHEYEYGGCDITTDFGLCGSKNQALKLMEDILKGTEKENACFRKHPSGFVIDRCVLDRAEWCEGFDNR